MPRRRTNPQPSPLAERVIAWQQRHGRSNLPWQGTRDPYRVWLSEVMLQQTQVSTVLDYYARFLARFPDVAALAAAPLDDVLALWSGLGYYSRARNLHRCAQAVVRQHGGAFPRSAVALAELPGIGRSTAAAIAAFCFGERVAILDGNVKRVLTRVSGFEGDLAVASEQRALRSRAEPLLMDLGATLCTTRAPRCADCPLTADCVARTEGRPERYPVKTRRLKRGLRANALLWLVDARGRLWLTQRPATGVWAGLWTLPLLDCLDDARALTERWPGAGQALTPIDHALTHFDWHLTPWRHALPEVTPLAIASIEAALPAGGWYVPQQALAMGLPAPIRKLLAS